MPEEMIFSRCKNYNTPICPHLDHHLMRKMIGGSIGTYLTGVELKEIDNLCDVCQEFRTKANQQ